MSATLPSKQPHFDTDRKPVEFPLDAFDADAPCFNERQKTKPSGTSRKRSKKELEATYHRNTQKKRDKAERDLRNYLFHGALDPWRVPCPPCKQGHYGNSQFLHVLLFTLRHFVGVSKVTFERWIEILKEWNDSLSEPFLYDPHCELKDSFWTCITVVVMRLAAQMSVEEQAFRQTSKVPSVKTPLNSEQRMYMYGTCIEGITQLCSLNYPCIINRLGRACRQLPDTPIKAAERDIAKNTHRPGDYLRESLERCFAEQYSQSCKNGRRQERIEKRIETLRECSICPTNPQQRYSEKQLPSIKEAVKTQENQLLTKFKSPFEHDNESAYVGLERLLVTILYDLSLCHNSTTTISAAARRNSCRTATTLSPRKLL